MWRQLWVVTRKEFWALRRDRGHIILLILAPILQLIIFGYAATQEVRNVEIAVLDHDGSALTRELMQKLQASGYSSRRGLRPTKRRFSASWTVGRSRSGLPSRGTSPKRSKGAARATCRFLWTARIPTQRPSSWAISTISPRISRASQLALNLQGPLVDDASGPPIRAPPRGDPSPRLVQPGTQERQLHGSRDHRRHPPHPHRGPHGPFLRERARARTLEQLVVTPLSGFALLLERPFPFFSLGC